MNYKCLKQAILNTTLIFFLISAFGGLVVGSLFLSQYLFHCRESSGLCLVGPLLILFIVIVYRLYLDCQCESKKD